MSENSWKSPAAIIGVLTVLVAVVGLYFTRNQDVRAEQELKNDSLKTDNEYYIKVKEQDQKEKEEESRREVQQEKDNEIRKQIAEVDNQIKQCKEKVASAQWEAKQCIGKNFDQDDPNQIVDCKEYIDEAKYWTSEWDKLENEKKVLQKQLNSH